MYATISSHDLFLTIATNISLQLPIIAKFVVSWELDVFLTRHEAFPGRMFTWKRYYHVNKILD